MEYSKIHTSDLVADSNSSWEEELQLLLESPTARAASANFFSSRLGTLDPYAANGTSGSWGSPDFARHLNMAGMESTNTYSDPVHKQGEALPDDTRSNTILQPLWNLSVPQQVSAAMRHFEQHQRVGPAVSPPSLAVVASLRALQTDPLHAVSISPPHRGSRNKGHQQASPGLYLSSNNHVVQEPQAEAQLALHLHGGHGHATMLQAVPAAASILDSDDTSWQHTPEQQQQVHPAGLQVTPLLYADDNQQQETAEPDLQGSMDLDAAHDDTHSIVAQPALPACSERPAGGRRCTVMPEASDVSAALTQPGTLVWAKYPRFPWWPAVIISPTACVHHPPPMVNSSFTSSQPSQPPVLVRFLGTYDASWVDPHKAVSEWNTNLQERSSKTKAAAFMAALKEAKTYVNTGVLPGAFSSPPSLSPSSPAATSTKTGIIQVKPAPKPQLVATGPSDGPLSPQLPPLDPGSPLQTSPSPRVGTTIDWQGSSAPGAVAQTVPLSAIGGIYGSPCHVDGSDADVGQAGLRSKSKQVKGGRKSSRAAVAGPAAGLRSVVSKRRSQQRTFRGSRHRRSE